MVAAAAARAGIGPAMQIARIWDRSRRPGAALGAVLVAVLVIEQVVVVAQAGPEQDLRSRSDLDTDPCRRNTGQVDHP